MSGNKKQALREAQDNSRELLEELGPELRTKIGSGVTPEQLREKIAGGVCNIHDHSIPLEEELTVIDEIYSTEDISSDETLRFDN